MTSNKLQIGISTGIEMLEDRYALTALNTIGTPVVLPTVSAVVPSVITATPYCDHVASSDSIDVQLLAFALSCLARSQSPQLQSRSTIDSIYVDTELSDAEWDQLEQLDIEGRGQLTLNPRQLPMR